MQSSNSSIRFNFKPIALSIHIALSTGLLFTTNTVRANTTVVSQQYRIAEGDLAQVLNQFAVQSGIALSAELQQLQGLKTQGLNGTYTIEQGFVTLLQGTNYQAQKTQDGYILIEKVKSSRDLGRLNTIDVNAKNNNLVADPNAVQLPVITVNAINAGYVPDKVNLGKINQSLKETPQSVSVLTNKRIEESGLTTLDQVLQQTTGMSVQTSGNVNTNYYSRGFEVAVQKDGINSGYAAGGERSLESLALYEQIEIQRGASGLLTGAGQPGGVVNLVRKKPLMHDEINVALKAGSWNTWNATFDTSNTFLDQNQLRSRFVVDYEDKEYFFDLADNKNLSLYGVIDYDIFENTTLSLGTTYNHREAVPEITGVPRNEDGSDSKFDKKKYLGAAWNKWEIDAYSVFAGIDHKFNEDWSLKLNGQYETRTLNYQRAFYNPSNLDKTTHVFSELTSYYSGDMDIKDSGFDATLNGKYEAFGHKHDLVFGYTSQKIVEPRPWLQKPISIPAVSLEDFDPYSVPYPEMSKVPTTTQRETRQSAFLAMTRINPIDPLFVILGARLSKWDFTNKNIVTGANTGAYQEKNVFTPYAGIVFNVNDDLTVYASYADTFRVQSNNYTYLGETLDPAIGANYEIGLKYGLWNDQAIASVALFRIDENDRALEDPDHPGACTAYSSRGTCYINGGKVRSQGFETELTGEVLPNLQLTAGYTYNKTEYLKDASTNQGNSYSTFTPKHIFKLWTSYNLPIYDQRLTIGGGATIQSETLNKQNNINIIQSGYGLWNAFANYKITDQVNVSLNVNNIFDKTYYKKLGSITNGNYYGDPRNFMLTLRAKY